MADTLRLVSLTKRLYNIFISLWDTLLGIHNHYYSILETKILENEESTRYRIKKSILLYHSYLSIIFSLVIPFFNPQASYLKSAVDIVLALGLMAILRGKNYHLIGSYVYVQAMISTLLQFATEKEPLTLLGHVLANQHMFFLFPEADLLRKIYVPLVIFLVQHMVRQLALGMEAWSYEPMETSIRSLDHAWVIIFLFHHYGARNLTTSYRLALINNVEIQMKLKETLSLLETSNKELTKALHARELFIASVSHELRNPLNCMMGNIELLRLDVKNEKWLKMLNICKICSEVLLGQINNVLDVAKINAEKLELHCVPGNFHRLVEKVWNISSIPIKQKRLKGELRISSDFPKYIMMDSHRLTQILLNLIGNASKFAKEGFVSISITWHHNESIEELKKPNQEYMALVSLKRKPSLSTEGARSLNLEEESDSSDQLPSLEINDHIEKSFAIEGVLHRDINPKLISQVLTSKFIHSTTDDVAIENKVEPKTQHHIAHEEGIIKIEVVDSGCGITHEALNKLFQPFTQADSSITRQYGGTGLGLYITKQIVQKMGGEIFAYSHENIGSDFCVLIPAETVNKEDVKDEECCAVANEHNLEAEQLRALVVDDLPGNQLVLTSYLQKLGVHSDTANDGLEAVNMFKSKGPNYYTFVTMDLQMPKMDGLTATKLIRKYEESKKLEDTPIIVITGNCAETEKAKCVDPNGELRAYGFYRKPFTFDECRSMLQSITMEKKALQLSQQRHPKVLIVDDDAFNTTVTQEYLEKHGFRCTGSSNGKEATLLTEKESFDFIVMDCEMPEMDGYTAASIIKKSHPDALILGVTGHRREEILQKCLDSGMFDVETKPIDFRKVVSVISKMTSYTIH